MRQYRKGRRLVALCEQKAQNVQRVLIRLNSDRTNLIAQIEQCETELLGLGRAMVALHINASSVSKSDIYKQRRQLAALLHQRQQAQIERVILQENLSDVTLDIHLNQKQLAVIKRKEMKFSRWMEQGKKTWLLQQDSVNEDESQEIYPWALKSNGDRT